MPLLGTVFLAVVFGITDILPVSSSAHVALAGRFLKLDLYSPEMEFALAMIRVGTMGAVAHHLWPSRKRILSFKFIRWIVIATLCTGIAAMIFKSFLVWMLFGGAQLAGSIDPGPEIQRFFRQPWAIAGALLAAGALIRFSAHHAAEHPVRELSNRKAGLIGLIHSLCFFFAGFSRTGATMSTAIVVGTEKRIAFEFSFALALALTPSLIALQFHRSYRTAEALPMATVATALLAMAFAFGSATLGLRWIESWLAQDKWAVFGNYCIGLAALAAAIGFLG